MPKCSINRSPRKDGNRLICAICRKPRVVTLEQTAQLINPSAKLMQLQRQQTAVSTQLNDIGIQFLLKAPHHLQPLCNQREVPYGDLILDFQ